MAAAVLPENTSAVKALTAAPLMKVPLSNSMMAPGLAFIPEPALVPVRSTPANAKVPPLLTLRFLFPPPVLMIWPPDSRMPMLPAERVPPLAVPPEAITTVTPLLTVWLVSVAPDSTSRIAPDRSVMREVVSPLRSSTTAPEEATALPPALTVRSVPVPPESRNSFAPLSTANPLARPPERTVTTLARWASPPPRVPPDCRRIRRPQARTCRPRSPCRRYRCWRA
jgi:hypothetical protein